MGAWQCSQDRVDGIVIQLEIFFLRSFPIADIRFVPDFPKPASSRHRRIVHGDVRRNETRGLPTFGRS